LDTSDAPAEVLTAKGATTVVELTRAQQNIARRSAEAKATIPDFSLHVDADMEDCLRLRTALQRLPGVVVPSYDDLLVRAAAIALREHPSANGSYRDGRLLLNARVNVGIALTADGHAAVPTIFDADQKSLTAIARERVALAERLRAGTITPPELSGATFTVSNLGAYGVDSFTAIISAPQAAILSAGALAQRAVVRNGHVLARHTITLTLACDHRILYGADAAQLLARIRQLLESPAALAA
jgi:pyruvate dehydrogenase E2 component (dihydrolipoamide acetyltransferase)